MKEIQQQIILSILRRRGATGLNSYDITYTYHIKQGPTRIKELRVKGYNIISVWNKDRSVTYILQDGTYIDPTPALQSVKQAWEEDLVPVVKNGHTTWERREEIETKQLDLL